MTVFTPITKQKLSWQAPDTVDSRTPTVFTTITKSSSLPYTPVVATVDFLFSDGSDFLFSDGSDYLFSS